MRYAAWSIGTIRFQAMGIKQFASQGDNTFVAAIVGVEDSHWEFIFGIVFQQPSEE